MQNNSNAENYAPTEAVQSWAPDSDSPKANRQRQLQANREYKDRLFRAIFGRDSEQSKRWRLDLYNALNGTAYTNPDELKLTTIENVIYVTMKNDISFLIGSQMNLYEQRLPYGKPMTFCYAESHGWQIILRPVRSTRSLRSRKRTWRQGAS